MTGISPRWIARIVLAAGIAATLALQTIVPPVEVFWSGDGGLKNLQAKQFAHGDFRVDLHLTHKDWVRDLWDSGLHPNVYADYAYNLGGKYFSVFPYSFPFVSAPFYALFGVRGYYVIPVVALWILWVTLYLAMRRANIDPCITAALMGAFIFATPITLYSATFWEHTLGLALAFGAFVYTLRYDDFEPGGAAPALAGALLGAAVWFRPETLALIAVLAPAAFVWRRAALGLRGWFLFSAGCAATVLLFFAMNTWIYGNPLGTHALQMTSGAHATQPLHDTMDRAVLLLRLCIRYAPIGGFAAFLVVALVWTKSFDLRSEYVYILVVAGLFFPLMIVMVPGDGGFQLGPRFALIMFPLIVLFCAYAWRAMPRSRAWRIAGIIVLVLTLVVGIKRIAVGETRWLVEEYRTRVLPAFEFVSARDETVVAVARVEVAQELGGLMERKDFFAAFDDERFAKLIAGLRAQHIDRFLFVGFGDVDREADSPLRHDVAGNLHVEPLGRHGAHFYCYAVTIPPQP